MAKQKSQIKIGILLSYLNLAVSSAIPFFYTPVMLRILGQGEYGLHSLASSTVGYLSLLSFGFGSTIIRYLTMYHAKGDKDNERKLFGFFTVLYSIIGFLVLIGGIIISNHTEAIFHRGIAGDELVILRTLIILMALTSAISFPTSVFSSVCMAYEQYIFRRSIDLLLTIINPIANLIVLHMGYASVGMAVVSLSVQCLMLPLYYCYCLIHLKIRPQFSLVPKELFLEMLSFSFFTFLAVLVDTLFWGTDKMLLGMFVSSSAVAVYNIGGTFNGIITSFSSALVNVLIPRVTTMVAKDESDGRLSELFIKVGRLQFCIIGLVVSGFAVFGQSFIRIWAGPSFAESYWVAVLTMFPLCIPLIQNTGLSIITAKNKHRFRSIVYLIIAIVNVISTYLLIPKYGCIGAAACSGVSYIVGQGIIMNLYYWKAINIDIPEFWKNITRMAVIPGVLLLTGLLSLRFVVIDSWLLFFALVFVYTLLYALLMYMFALNDYEKDVFAGLIRRRK